MLNSKLTPTEKEILDMLVNERMTPKQMKIRRNCSQEAINKVIRNLKKKGLLKISCHEVVKMDGTPQPSQQIRIHAQQFSIKILWKSPKYKEILERCNNIIIDNNTINLWQNNIDIYSNQSFDGDTLPHVFHKSAEYWQRFFARLENEISCLIFKPRSQNIKLVRLHIAETNNEIAQQVDNAGERWFKVYAPEDGKLCFLIDNSFNLHEFEAVHSKTAKPDMEKVGKIFIDIREKESYLPSDTKGMLDKLTMISSNMLEYSAKTNQNVAWLAENIKQHGPAWFGMAKEASNIRKEVKRLSGILAQKKLGEWI